MMMKFPIGKYIWIGKFRASKLHKLWSYEQVNPILCILLIETILMIEWMAYLMDY